MNKPPIKLSNQSRGKGFSNRKKHVETMFLTNKAKHHLYYYKNRSLVDTTETNQNNSNPPAFSISIRALKGGYLTLKPLKSVARFFKWFLKNYLVEDTRLRLRVFPDFVLTSKPKEVRMGKGKGANLQKVAPIKAGQILLSVKLRGPNNPEFVRALITKMSFKIPFSHKIVINDW